ncbi:hypothetical protein HO133_000662 [Letharia lupina]|uniref:Uncharacterized protein n=1 Tax=Letharia lupina TaxID=560253 RepID=A0A8H6CFI7_9LECA|nr:uncharacterized protein HO133_000662 [Letharia lupina]KAF6222615.1 hypothetical protein HO133_000662 [Letharia lupina]
MAEVERSLSAMWNIRVNTMVKKVERQTHGVAVPISDRASNIEKKGHSDQVILAIKPKAIRQFSSRGVGLFPSSSPPMSVTKAEKSKWLLNPTAELRWMRDSEVLTVRTRACDNGKATVSLLQDTLEHHPQATFTKIHSAVSQPRQIPATYSRGVGS